MADSVFGSAFYASTGLHGLITIVPIKHIFSKNLFLEISKLSTFSAKAAATLQLKSKSLTIIREKKDFPELGIEKFDLGYAYLE